MGRATREGGHMTHYDSISGLTVILQAENPDNPGVISYYPSIIDDATAAAEALLAEESAKSFMQTQWRLSAANIQGIGVIAAGWA